MRNFIIKRIIMSIGILFCVTLIIYTLIRCLPSSYVESMAMQLSSAPGAKSYDEWLAQLNASYGLDQPILVGYVGWLGDFFQGSHLFPGGNLYLVSRLYRPQRHNHIVIVINLYEILHNAALIPFVLISSRYSATLSASPAT